MARLDVPLVFCGSMFYTVVLLFHLTALTVSQSTADSNTTTTIVPTSVFNGSNVSVTDSEATELFSSNYPSSSVSSKNSGESISPSSSFMFIDSTSNLSIAISVNSSIDMSSYISSSSAVYSMTPSNNPTETMSLSDNPMESSTPNMQLSSDTATLTSTSVNNKNSNNQISASQTTTGSSPDMSISQTTDIAETNSPMISTGLNSITSINSPPSSMGNIESSEPIDLESSVSEYLTSSDSEVTSSIIATKNPSLTSAVTEMTSTPIVDASSSVFINSVVSDMPSSSETPISSQIQSASSSVSSLGIVPSSTVTPVASSSNIQLSSSVLPMTTTTTTTTPTPPTTTIPPSSTLADDIQSSIDGNSLFEVTTELDIICVNITSDEELRKFIQDEVLTNVEAVRKVVVVKNGCKVYTRRKRALSSSSSSSEVTISVDAKMAANDPTEVASQISRAFENNTASNITNANFLADAQNTFNDSCKAGVCNKLYGYMCTRINSTHGTCTSRCKGKTCSGHGTCSTIVTDSNDFGHHCSCHSEEYYKYEGEKCEDKRMKWELAVAIAAGSGGAVILILVFVLIICCCCKNKGDKYGYDRRHSYEPMSDVIGRSGPAYYRNDSKNQQPGFTNLGYDDDKYSDYSDPSQTRPPNGQSWNPEDSKDTYAKITEQLDQEKRFEIKRPQVSGSIRQNSSAEATTGF